MWWLSVNCPLPRIYNDLGDGPWTGVEDYFDLVRWDGKARPLWAALSLWDTGL